MNRIAASEQGERGITPTRWHDPETLVCEQWSPEQISGYIGV